MGPQPGQQASSSVPPEASPQPGAWAAPPEPAGPAPGIRYAGHGGRLVAYLVDLLLAGVIGVIVTIALSLIGVLFESFGFDGLAGVMLGVGLVAWLVITFGYFPWFWARLGQTPGMRLFGLRVVRDRDGGPISGGQAVLRLIGFWVNSAVLYIGWIWIFVDSRRRGWHDLIAGTVVIEEER